MNKSSEPISIIEFTLSDKYHFNSYSKPGGYYTITILPDKILSKDGVLFGLGDKSICKFFLEDRWFNPIFTIEPYASVWGYIFFNISEKESMLPGVNKLKVFSSREEFEFDFELYEVLESKLEK